MKHSLLSPVCQSETCFVKITLKEITNIDKILNDKCFIRDYLENLTNYKLTNDLFFISDLDVTTLEVKVKCPDRTSAVQFKNDLNSLQTDHRFKISDDESINSSVKIIEHITTKYDHLLKQHDDKILELDEKINLLYSRTKFFTPDEFKERKQVQETYTEKIDELKKQKLEFQNTFNLIKDSFDHYNKNNIRAKEEIIRLEKLFQREENRLKAILPIYAHKSYIIESVTKNQVVILLGETGSGKTTQIIQYLYDAWSHSDRIIVCTQPRKVAATSVAMRVAEEMNVKLGGLVGYQVGMDCKKSKDTLLLFMTDHMLLNECQTDRNFTKYSCIILDEAHERTIYTDLLLGFIKQSLNTRPDLKLIVTSATINPDVFIEFFKSFNPPVVRVSGRIFPVETIYEPSMNDDYLINAVEKAASLHCSESLPGDILAFLTSPAETDLAAKKLSKMGLKNVSILTLHGQLQVSQQREALAPTKPNMRKIIFATNSAETSITIPGIRHVVDPGLVKEAVFDNVKNMTSLVIQKTTRSSANQRKGRAGRTESGKCYRLYSVKEFEEMKENSIPEILRVHLGQSMLKLMMMNVPEPDKFDFVEAPAFASIQAAMNLLRELGAIDARGITETGKKLAVLNLEPRLGKFALMSMDEGTGYEAIVICALSSSGNQIFFRGGSDQDKFLSDLKKTSFCDDYGDLITLLNVFKKWEDVPKNQRVKWCVDNSINSKRIKGASDMVEETMQSFRNQLGLLIEKKFSIRTDINEMLARNIFKCFQGNLTRYTGHRKLGFRVMKEPHMSIHVHPSSALTYLEQLPLWVVFQSLLTTTQEFMLNVTYIKEEWVAQAMNCGELSFCQEDIDAVILKTRQLPSVGLKMKKMLFSKHTSYNKSTIEAKIRSKDERISAFIELNDIPHVFLHASTLFFDSSFAIALEEINQMKVNLSKEIFVKSITSSSQIQFVMVRGMRIVALLMLNEFLEVEIPNQPNMLGHLKTFEMNGKIEFSKFIESKKTLIVTFTDPMHAQQFLKQHGGMAKIDQERISETNNFAFPANVSMIRRPAKQISFIEFRNTDDRNEFLGKGQIILNSQMIPFKADRNSFSKIIIFRTPPWATKELILEAISESFPRAKIVSVQVTRVPPPTLEQTKIDKEFFMKNVSDCCNSKNSFKISLKEPKPKDFTLNAAVTFLRGQNALVTVQRLNEIPSFTAALDLSIKFYTPSNVYNNLKNVIDEKFDDIKRLTDRVTRTVKEPLTHNKDFMTLIEVQTFEDYDYVKNEMTPFLSGLSWKTELFVALKKLNNDLMRELCLTNYSTCFTFNEFQKCLFIFGSRQNIDMTKECLKDTVSTKQSYICREVSLRNLEYPKGIMKQIILNNGCDVEKCLKESCNAENVKIMLKKHVIIIEGSDKAYDKLIQMLNEVSAQLNSVKIIENDPNTIGECPICLSDIKRSDYFVSELCGHIYCNTCARQLIKSNIDQKIIPMKCVIEGCNEPFDVHDVQSLISSKADISKLEQVALINLQSSQPDRYKFCPTPDCPTIFTLEISSRSSNLWTNKTYFENEMICSECGLSLCKYCGSIGHTSISCRVNKLFSEMEEIELKSWLSEDMQNRGICPKCNSGIEKNGGCNHLECLTCRKHICWKCRRTFDSSQACYSHMGSVHGGY